MCTMCFLCADIITFIMCSHLKEEDKNEIAFFYVIYFYNFVIYHNHGNIHLEYVLTTCKSRSDIFLFWSSRLLFKNNNVETILLHNISLNSCLIPF